MQAYMVMEKNIGRKHYAPMLLRSHKNVHVLSQSIVPLRMFVLIHKSIEYSFFLQSHIISIRMFFCDGNAIDFLHFFFHHHVPYFSLQALSK